MIVIFGEYANGVLDCMWQYDPVTHSWEKLSSNGTDKPGPRRNFSAVATPDGLLITGGEDYNGVFQRDNWLYDMNTGSWEKKEAQLAADSSYGMT